MISISATPLREGGLEERQPRSRVLGAGKPDTEHSSIMAWHVHGVQSTMHESLAPGVVRASALWRVKVKLCPGCGDIRDSSSRNYISLPHQGLMALIWQVLEKREKEADPHHHHITWDHGGDSGCSSRAHIFPSRHPPGDGEPRSHLSVNEVAFWEETCRSGIRTNRRRLRSLGIL